MFDKNAIQSNFAENRCECSMGHGSMGHVPRLHKSGGGVGLLFRSTLSVTVKSETKDFTSFEAIHVEITLNSQSFRLVNIYRPPSNFGAFLNEFETMVANYILHPSEIVFCGDFNIHNG